MTTVTATVTAVTPFVAVSFDFVSTRAMPVKVAVMAALELELELEPIVLVACLGDAGLANAVFELLDRMLTVLSLVLIVSLVVGAVNGEVTEIVCGFGRAPLATPLVLMLTELSVGAVVKDADGRPPDMLSKIPVEGFTELLKPAELTGNGLGPIKELVLEDASVKVALEGILLRSQE